MKWIIVNLYHTPAQLNAGEIEMRKTVDVDDIKSVMQTRKTVKRDGELAVDNVTYIFLNSDGYIACSDSFKDVITAIELSRNTENRRRKAGEVFFCSVIDVQEIVAEGAKEAVEVKEERCPFKLGDVIVYSVEGQESLHEWTVERVTQEHIEMVAEDGKSPGVVYRQDWGKYKVVQKGG